MTDVCLVRFSIFLSVGKKVVHLNTESKRLDAKALLIHDCDWLAL